MLDTLCLFFLLFFRAVAFNQPNWSVEKKFEKQSKKRWVKKSYQKKKHKMAKNAKRPNDVRDILSLEIEGF